MGLLDEAIREHLDLKRKRGADPTELTRQEQEALGPAVRERVAEVPEQGSAEPAHQPYLEPIPGEPIASGTAGPGVHPGPEPASPDEPLVPDPEAPAPPDPDHEPSSSAGQETAVFDVDDVFAEEDKQSAQESAAEDEDVLEETPEFLQETPEHDRLWFEQKPPRDFDFDG